MDIKSKTKDIFHSRTLTSVFFVIILFLFVGLVNHDFLAPRNILLTLNASVVFILLTIGIGFPIMTGEIDVSIGAVLGLSAAISATMIRNGSNFFVALLVAILIGAVIGLFNGFGLEYLGIPSIIITLGSNGIVRGLIYVFTGGKWVENLPYEFKSLSQKTFLGLTWFFWIAILIAIACTYYMTHAKRGKNFAAVGDNIGGATLIGIPVKYTKVISFVLSSVFASVAGVIYASRIGFVTPTAGLGYEMKAIAACVLGGVSLAGGIGTLLGASFGAVIMASIGRILVFLKFSSDYDNTITGILLISIVVVDALMQKRNVEKTRRERLLAKTAKKELNNA
ncbi:MAG: ABC transporter permease [Sphaerochaeta sp.]